MVGGAKQGSCRESRRLERAILAAAALVACTACSDQSDRATPKASSVRAPAASQGTSARLVVDDAPSTARQRAGVEDHSALGAIKWTGPGQAEIVAGVLDRYFDVHDGAEVAEPGLEYLSCVYVEHAGPDGMLVTRDGRVLAWSSYSRTPDLAGRLDWMDRLAFVVGRGLCDGVGRHEGVVRDRVAARGVATGLSVKECRLWRRGQAVSSSVYAHFPGSEGSVARGMLFALERFVLLRARAT